MTVSMQMWEVSREGTVQEVSRPTNTLDSDLAYVVLGATQPRMVFAWVGESATSEAKEAAQRHASELAEKLPEVAASLFHMEGSESEAFLAAMDTLPETEAAEQQPLAVQEAAVKPLGSQSPASKASKKREKKKKKQEQAKAAAATAEAAADPAAGDSADADGLSPEAAGADAKPAICDSADAPAEPKEETAQPEDAEPTKEAVRPTGATPPAGPEDLTSEPLADPGAAVAEKEQSAAVEETPTEQVAVKEEAPAVAADEPDEAETEHTPSPNPDESTAAAAAAPEPTAPVSEDKPMTAAEAKAALQAAAEIAVSAPPKSGATSAASNYLADAAKAWGAPTAVAPAAPSLSSATVLPEDKLFEYEELKGLRAESGIDMTRKEDYLSEGDFEKVFGKTRAEFTAMPGWRRLAAKRDAGLF